MDGWMVRKTDRETDRQTGGQAHTDVRKEALENSSVAGHSHDEPHYRVVGRLVVDRRDVGEALEEKDHQLLQGDQEGL